MWAKIRVGIALFYFVFIDVTSSYKVGKYPLLMPAVSPSKVDAYLCTPIKIDSHKNYYVTGFEPYAESHTVHHMLVFGCKAPGSRTSVWNCGEMALAEEGKNVADPCSEGAQIIYAWAMDAKKLELPEGVGFKIGGDSPIQYLVLQIHYANIDHFSDGTIDKSGVYLEYTERPQEKQAGVILLGTGGVIQSQSVEHMETACSLKEDKIIHPFAFRTHTHKLGTVVSGYRVRKLNGNSQWELLGKRSPQTPQMFYESFSKEPIYKGDVLAARCTMYNNRTSVVQVGSTNKDEMCNFYLMYYVENGEPLRTKNCFSPGPPFYYWTHSNLNNIPEHDASTLEDDETNRVM